MLSFIDIPAPDGPFVSDKKMIIMHGRGDVKESFIPFCRELNITGLSYRLLDAPSNFMFGYSWYPLPPEPPFEAIRDAIQLVNQQIKEMKLATENVFLAGFSQGASIALEMAMQEDIKFAGVIALSPRIFPRDEILKKSHKDIDAFIAHGEFDEAIPFTETTNGVNLLKNTSMNIEFHRYDMAHEIDIQEIMDLREWLNERI